MSHRSPEAVDFLFEQLAEAEPSEAEEAAGALAVLKHDPEVEKRLRQVDPRRLKPGWRRRSTGSSPIEARLAAVAARSHQSSVISEQLQQEYRCG